MTIKNKMDKKKINFYRFILNNLLKKFNVEEIDYCILRNHDFFLGGDTFGTDFDLAISEVDLKKAKKIMNDFKFIDGPFNPDKSHKSFLYFSNEEKEDIAIDVHRKGFTFAGVSILKNSDILKRKKKNKFVFSPSNEDSIIILILQSILNRANFKRKYIEEIEFLWNKINIKKLEEYFEKIFNKKTSKEIIKRITEKKYKELLNMRKKLITLIILKKPWLLKDICLTLIRRRISRNFLRKLYFFNLFNLAPYFAFVGVDGSGKSTSCIETKNLLEKNGISCKILRMSSYTARTLPIRLMLKLFGKQSNNSQKKDLSEITNDIMGKTPRSKSYYLLKDILHGLDMILKYLKILYYRKKGYVVLTDRYVYDLIAYFGENRFRKKIAKSYPKPNLTFYLYHDVKKMKQRKPEYTIEGLKKITSRYEKLADIEKFVKIKTINIDKVISKINEGIYPILLKKSNYLFPKNKYKEIHSIIK